MNSWLLTQQIKSGDAISNGEGQQIRYTEIDNYYGAHKNFKTDFRNKKYRNVYMQLIHRKPAQAEYKVLYYQDILISIIKTLEISFLGKEGHIGPIEPFFHFGTKAIKQFYWLFLVQRRFIDREMAIDPAMQSKISNFLTLIIDFCCKISLYLFVHANHVNSEKIFYECYHNVVKCVIDSSTSNLLLLKKCGQFLLQYANFCLKTGKYPQAHEILKDGLKTQLNQLILLKYDIKRRKNLKKSLKRYWSTLKVLSHFYIYLGLYFEKQSSMYQCATAILDAVLIEELISIQKIKMKKWVCGLEASYVEEKNKCLEIMRICNKFFDSQFFEELASKAKAQSRKSVVQNNRSFGALRRCKQSIKSNGLDSIYQNTHTRTPNKQGEEKQKVKFFKQKRSNQCSVKQVRFKLNQEVIQTKSETHTFKMSEKKIGGICPSSQDVFKYRANNNQQKQCESIKNVISCKILSQQDELAKMKLKAQADNIENNQFLLFGESFWENKKTAIRSKSTSQKMKDLFQLEIKKTRRKLSYNNISYVQANNIKSMGQKNKKANKYLKQNFENGRLRKRGRDKGLFLQRCEQNPDNIIEVNRKISDWHKNSAKIQTDLMNKMGRLKQRKNIKNQLNVNDTIQYVETERQSSQKQQKSIALIQQDLQVRKNQEVLMKKGKKQTPISIFKKFLIENKTFFNISKVELLNSVTDLESQKRYLSFLIAQKPQKVQKYVQKNHWQAKFNIQYFMNQIQESNKKLNKSLSKTNKKSAAVKQIYSSQCEYLQGQKISNTEASPSNLFGTSLKSRAQQMVRLL